MNPEQTPIEPTPTQPLEQPAVNQPSEPPVVAPRIHSSKGSGSIEAITEPGEKLVFRTKKHPFGIAVMYLQAFLALILVGGLAYFVVPGVVSADQQSQVKGWLAIGLALFAMVIFLIMLVVTYIYSRNELILTDRNVTQIISNGLFSRQVSQLSLNNIEDVTADKEGIWAMIFNFGQVRVETAGEQNNFHFAYCPNPNYYGQLLLDTRARCAGRGNSPPH
jgi:hypothetical protein